MKAELLEARYAENLREVEAEREHDLSIQGCVEWLVSTRPESARDKPRMDAVIAHLRSVPTNGAELVEALQPLAALPLPEDGDGTPDEAISGRRLPYVISQDAIRAARQALANARAK